MDWWIVALLLVVSSIALLLVVPIDIAVSLQARGEPEGDFAVAGGGKVGPFAATFVVARGVPLTTELRVLGRSFAPRAFGSKRKRQTEQKPERRRRTRPRWVDPFDLFWFLFEERRRITLRWLDVALDYSFENLMLTGELLASVSVLTGLLPARVHLRHTPRWELEDRAALVADGRFRLWPGLLLVDTLRFVMQSRMLSSRRHRPDQATGQSGEPANQGRQKRA